MPEPLTHGSVSRSTACTWPFTVATRRRDCSRLSLRREDKWSTSRAKYPPRQQIRTKRTLGWCCPVEWTRRPIYSVVAQSAVNKLKTGRVHWLDVYTGPITWQIRDQAALLSMIELPTRAHKTASAIFADGEQYAADPASPDYHAA